MIIGKDFAWGHIPRTAGDATRAKFKVLQLFHPIYIDPETHAKHDPFTSRPESNGKDLILNIRKLPAFFLSWFHLFRIHGIWRDFKPLPNISKNDLFNDSPEIEYAFTRLDLPGPFLTLPDRYLLQFTDNQRLPIRTWFRSENLFEDFICLMRQYYSFPPQLDWLIENVPTKPLLNYNHDVHLFFSASEIQTLYDHNPLWSEIESKVYASES